MKRRNKIIDIFIEFFSRTAQITVGMVVIGPLVSGGINLITILVGIVSIIFSLSIATLISLGIKESE